MLGEHGTDDAEALVDLFSDEEHALDGGHVKLELEPHGFDGCAWGARDGAGRRS
jgi:hypothetical protein